MDNHSGVILYLMEQLKFQEWKESVIAYSFLLREGPLSENDLDVTCEQYLSNLQSNSGKFLKFFQNNSINIFIFFWNFFNSVKFLGKFFIIKFI